MAQIFWPTDPSRITEGYGCAAWRRTPQNPTGLHDGIDFGITQGTELRATASGIIRNNDAGQEDGAGVDIKTADGWTVRHWHVSKFLVPNGTQVSAGDVIALSGGNPGTWGAGFSTGAHLHWGVKTGSSWVNPAELNPQYFDQQQEQLPEGLEMANIYVNSENGQNVLMKPETGFEWIIPTEAYKALVIAMGLVEKEISATPDQINFLRQISKK